MNGSSSGLVQQPRVWSVGGLCRAIDESLGARFSPVAVEGEISGLTRAASGHLYFSLKDDTGQLRCAMFRRAASLLTAIPRNGDRAVIRGRVGVYEMRGELQIVVESLTFAGQGVWFERFMQTKTRLEAEGLFDPARKRQPVPMPRRIGVVTSLGAAALHDVSTALRRRVPHVSVVVAPAAVQGAQASAELIRALDSLYRCAQAEQIDVILLVRGGGSIEDLWSFNDESLARMIVNSPVPVICGVGHETDFTIADLCADVRAPTPTAAAELAAVPTAELLAQAHALKNRLEDAAQRQLDRSAQQMDMAAKRMGRPSARVGEQLRRGARLADYLRHALQMRLQKGRLELEGADLRQRGAIRLRLESNHMALQRQILRLDLLDPRLVLGRGYAFLTDDSGKVIARAAQARQGQRLLATLSDGGVDVTVVGQRSL